MAGARLELHVFGGQVEKREAKICEMNGCEGIFVGHSSPNVQTSRLSILNAGDLIRSQGPLGNEREVPQVKKSWEYSNGIWQFFSTNCNRIREVGIQGIFGKIYRPTLNGFIGGRLTEIAHIQTNLVRSAGKKR